MCIRDRCVWYVDRLFLGLAGIVTTRSTGNLQEIFRDPRGALVGFRDKRESVEYRDYIGKIRNYFKTKERAIGNRFRNIINKAPTDSTRNTYDKRVSDNRITTELRQSLIEYGRPISITRGGLNRGAKNPPLTFGDGLGNSERQRLQDVFTEIRNWENRTPVGINNLAEELSQQRFRGNDRVTPLIDNIQERLRLYAGSKNSNVALANQEFRQTKNIYQLLGDLSLIHISEPPRPY